MCKTVYTARISGILNAIDPLEVSEFDVSEYDSYAELIHRYENEGGKPFELWTMEEFLQLIGRVFGWDNIPNHMTEESWIPLTRHLKVGKYVQ